MSPYSPKICNDEVYAIVNKLCEGKKFTDPIFTDPKGRPWTRWRIDHRFQQVRKLVGLRKDVTVYSFRHLFISEMLMCGNDVATVAKAAGTSIMMIERVYGHFSSDHLHDAQNRLDVSRQQRREQASPKPNAA
jgi:site-specific recombinase XerD